MKVALVYDRVNKYGGAERVLTALAEIWPEAPLYTAVYNPGRARWADIFQVHPSFLNRIPTARNNHEFLALLTPLAFESFDFDDFDVVISVTSADAKSLITKPSTVHICYCLTPTRYLWSGYQTYIRASTIGLYGGIAPKILQYIAPTLKRWDLISAERPDYFIAISNIVKARIESYYHRKVSAVIYPPVDTKVFFQSDRNNQNNTSPKYYLAVSRLVGYKRLDIVLDAFNTLRWPLVIIGTGREEQNLIKRAGVTIRFVTRYLTDTELVDYYKNCRALVFAGIEDFGLTSVEAQASGKPVLAYRYSGMAETVIEGETGDFFEDQSTQSLIDLLKKTEHTQYLARACRDNALQYDKKVFENKIINFVRQTVRKRGGTV